MRLFLLLAGLNGFLAVALGAFGAHGLKERLSPTDLETWLTGVRYQAWHALALLGLACLPAGWRRVGPAALLLALGTVIFSGTLYALVLLDQRWLGAVTPVGGTLMIAGWVVLALSGPPGRTGDA
jgi:uncharacterized membrane protein YgdD (TMEM256/DUF423 family)